MNSYTDNKLINLTSESATQFYNSTFLSNLSFDTPGLLIASPFIKRVELSTIHAEIPVSFYTINYSNSFFKYSIDNGTILTQQVPVGNYNANSLISALLTLINDANFEIIINKVTGVIQFHHNKTFTIYTDNIHKIDLQLYDEDFNYINFNNINWSILFCLYITYEIPAFTIPTQIDAQANLRENKPIDKPIDNPNINELDFLNS